MDRGFGRQRKVIAMRMNSWLNSLRFLRPTAVSDHRRRSRSRGQMALQSHELETRMLLAAVSWDGGGDYQWSNAANWSGDVLPGAADDVTIDFGTNDFTVVLAGASTSIDSLNAQSRIVVSGGGLLLAKPSQIMGSLVLQNATFGGSGLTTVGAAHSRVTTVLWRGSRA